ncbi:MAG: hypothetical protein KKB70_05945, partial [Proteobacteria bacterium]|nr:hypothetical protein [Pseudomonadota bacterium]
MKKPTLYVWMLAALLAGVFLSGCAAKEEDPNLSEDAFEKWRLMAEQSQGHSPSGKLDVKEIEELVIEADPVEDVTPVVPKTLPQFKVTLRMHDADLVAVIQALSRAASQSIVVSPQVEGVV